LLLELLHHVVEDSTGYLDDEQKADAVTHWTSILERWQVAGDLWSGFFIRMLSSIMPRPCAAAVDSFLLGAKTARMTEAVPKEQGVEEILPDVTEHIEHAEAAAVIHPLEAAMVSGQRWAGCVQQRDRVIADMRDRLLDSQSAYSGSSVWIESCAATVGPFEQEWTGEMRSRASQFGDTVYLIKFTRAGRDLQAAVASAELESIRNEASGAGFEFKLPCGAHVLLYPNQYTSIQTVVKLEDLRPHHVLINEAFLPLLLSSVQKLPSRSNVRPTSIRPAALVGDDNLEVAIVKKTFIDFESRLLTGAASVAQSATDVRHGANPRRYCIGFESITCCMSRSKSP